MLRCLIMVFLCFSLAGVAQSGDIYAIYTNKGKRVSYKKMLNTLKKNDVVLFGEFHNNSIIHWLQLHVTKDLLKIRPLVLGAEMFESDQQDLLSNYINSKISQSEFEHSSRLWNNYQTDYKLLVEFAKANEIDFVATNIPRRYASMLYKFGDAGLDSLSLQEYSWIAPLPFPYDSNLPGYRSMLTMLGSHPNDNLPKSQAIKDATMGYFIAQKHKPGHLFIHYNGTYHSKNYEGIVWYLQQYANYLKVATISMVESSDVGYFNQDNLGEADFIILIDVDVLKTF